MNKKIFIMPIAICAMGLASCNGNSWPTKTNEEAKTVAAKIAAAATEMLKDPTKFSSLKIEETSYTKQQIGKSSGEYKGNGVTKLDANNLYGEEFKHYEEISNSESRNSSNKSYYIYDTDSAYSLKAYEYTGKKETKTKDDFKKGLIEDGFKTYTKDVGDIYVDINNFDDFVKGIESEKETLKSYGDVKFEYHFESKDEKSLRLVVEASGKDFTKIPPMATGFKTLSSASLKTEWKIENNFVTYTYSSMEAKGTDDNDLEKYMKDEEIASYEIDGNISRDSINLKDYLIQ